MKFSLEGISDVKELVRELSNILRNLDIANNFRGFETTVTIPAKGELSVRNNLTRPIKRYIILDQTGNGLITRSSTIAPSKDSFNLINNGDEEVTATILFME